MHAPVSQPLHAVPVEMSAAIHEARASIQQFFDAFAAPRANQGSFFLRVRFTGRSASGDAAAEHLWLAELDLWGERLTGVIASDPYLPGLVHRQRVAFHASQVSDWMFLEDGRPVGAFTTRLLRGDAPQRTSRFSLLRDLWML